MANASKEVNMHFFNVADAYLVFHKSAEPELQAIMDALNDVSMEGRTKAWCDDVDSITEIIEQEKQFTLAVQKLITRKAAIGRDAEKAVSPS